MLYEQKVHRALAEMYDAKYLPSPWIKFQNDYGVRWCQLDSILFLPEESAVVVVEAKLQHTPKAYFQIEDLYLPLIRQILQPHGWTDFRACEVVRWYDPAIVFPVEPVLRKTVDSVKPGEFGVHILTP